MSVNRLTENPVGCQTLVSVTRSIMSRGRKPRIAISERPAWAQRLIAARGKLSQQEAANRTGIPQTTYAGYETGESQPDFAQIERIAATLGVPASFIAFGAAEPPENGAHTGALIERHKNDDGFGPAVIQTVAMLHEEGFDADVDFAVRLALRLLKQANSSPDHRSLRERISAAIGEERAQVRAEIARARKNRLQP